MDNESMIPLKQAVMASAVLSSITQRIQQSQQMMTTIQPLLPAGLRSQVTPGPVDEAAWCLFVTNPAVASKLRQLTPTLLAALRSAGWSVNNLRLKVRAHGR
jgi:hypothetical protein